MKRFFSLSGTLLCLVLSVSSGFAQQKNAAPVKGQFEIKTSTTTQVQAQYTLTPAYPDNLVLQIRPSAPFTLDARIVNDKGIEQMKLGSEQVTLRYVNNIDMARLAKGHYFIEIQAGMDKQQTIKIPFTR
jgi:hypothetical protein